MVKHFDRFATCRTLLLSPQKDLACVNDLCLCLCLTPKLWKYHCFPVQKTNWKISKFLYFILKTKQRNNPICYQHYKHVISIMLNNYDLQRARMFGAVPHWIIWTMTLIIFFSIISIIFPWNRDIVKDRDPADWPSHHRISCMIYFHLHIKEVYLVKLCTHIGQYGRNMRHES